jgi:hypothetical protein
LERLTKSAPEPSSEAAAPPPAVKPEVELEKANEKLSSLLNKPK